MSVSTVDKSEFSLLPRVCTMGLLCLFLTLNKECILNGADIVYLDIY